MLKFYAMERYLLLQVIVLAIFSHDLLVNARSLRQERPVHRRDSPDYIPSDHDHNIQNPITPPHSKAAAERIGNRVSNFGHALPQTNPQYYQQLREPAYVITSYKVELKHPEPLTTGPAAKALGPYYFAPFYNQAPYTSTYERQGATHPYAMYPQFQIYQPILPVYPQGLNQSVTIVNQAPSPNHENPSFKRATKLPHENRHQQIAAQVNFTSQEKAKGDPAVNKPVYLSTAPNIEELRPVEKIDDPQTSQVPVEPFPEENQTSSMLHNSDNFYDITAIKDVETMEFTTEHRTEQTPDSFVETTGKRSITLPSEAELIFLADSDSEATTEGNKFEFNALTTTNVEIEHVRVTEVSTEATVTTEISTTEDTISDSFFKEKPSIGEQLAFFESTTDEEKSEHVRDAPHASPVTEAQGTEAIFFVEEELTIAEQLAVFEPTTEEAVTSPITEVNTMRTVAAFEKEELKTEELFTITESNTEETTGAVVAEDEDDAIVDEVDVEMLTEASQVGTISEQHPIPEPPVESSKSMDVPVQLIFRLTREPVTTISEDKGSVTTQFKKFASPAWTAESKKDAELTSAIEIDQTSTSMENLQPVIEAIMDKLDAEVSKVSLISQSSSMSQGTIDDSVKKEGEPHENKGEKQEEVATTHASRSSTRRRKFGTKMAPSTTTTAPLPSARTRLDYNRLRKPPLRKIEGTAAAFDWGNRSTEASPVGSQPTANNQRPRIINRPLVQNQTFEEINTRPNSSKNEATTRRTIIRFTRGPDRFPNSQEPSDLIGGLHLKSTEPTKENNRKPATYGEGDEPSPENANKNHKVHQITTRKNVPCPLHKVKHALLNGEEQHLPPGAVVDSERKRVVLPEGFSIHYNPEDF